MSTLELNEPFWINKPQVLFTNCNIIPTTDMTGAERLNALTRLLLIITIVMYFMGYDQYFTVLALGIILIFILRGQQSKDRQHENFSPRRGNHDPCHTCGQDSNMAYINSKYETTPINQYSHVNYGLRSYTNAKYKVIPEYVPPAYSEVWRQESRFCNEFSQFPKTYDITPPSSYNYITGGFSQPTNKCNFADRQWVTNTPGGVCPQGRVSAMPAVQSAFMRDSMEFRNNIMGEIVDQFERERQHNCVGFKPGRKTF